MTSSAPVSRALADVTDAGAFGPGSRFVSFESSARPPDRTASAVVYGTLTVSDQQVRRRHHLVVKLRRRTSGPGPGRARGDDDRRFRSEMLFYERVVPFLLDCAMAGDDPLDRVPPLCHYFYGRDDGGGGGRGGHLALRDMIVLEDVTVLQGYRRPDDRSRLDFDHLVVALRTLAKFHGLSYGAKHADPVGFAETVAGVEETRTAADESSAELADRFSAALDRARGEPTRRLRAEALRGGDAAGAMRRAALPAEPLSVLCHGRYGRHELLFRYDADGPVEAMPLGMTAVRYGSPALDVSHLLYADADRTTRDRGWDALLDEYCAALSAGASGSAPVPDRARLDAEMRDHAFYGLARASLSVRADHDDGDDDEAIADAVRHYVDRVLADDR